jgi:hypothetical protein
MHRKLRRQIIDEAFEMEKDWKALHNSNSTAELEMIKGMLEVHGILSIIINQKDSSYISIGDGTLYVKDSDFLKAKTLIDNQEPAEK